MTQQKYIGRILVACEYSGIVRDAFAAKGWDAWSCDLLPSEKPGNHHQGDVFEFLTHSGLWDIMIHHWECTLLCNSGVRWLYCGGGGNRTDARRFKEMQQSAYNFERLSSWQSIPHICGENPIQHKYARQITGDYSQIIQPWQFGHGETKATCLWLKNLPPLVPTNIVSGREQKIWKMPPSENRWKERSRTYTGIAEAMADQWTTAFLANTTGTNSSGRCMNSRRRTTKCSHLWG